MAGSGYIQVPPDSTGKQVDMVSATVGGVTVSRQVFALANNADGQTIAEVVAASASTGAVGVVVRPTTATVALVTGTTVTVDGTVNISAMPAIGVSIGAVAISGTALVSGVVNISAMPAITGSVGINSIGTVTVTGGVAISGTAQVAIGTAINVNPIALSAGTANIGSINHISRSVVAVVAGFYPNSSGATNTIQVADSANSAIRVNIVAGGTGGGLVSVTGTVAVSGAVSLAAGTANIGSINNISATVLVAGSLSIGSFLDAGSYTAAQANVTIMGGVFGDSYTALTTSQGGAVKITSARAIHVNMRDSAGNELSTGTANIVGVVSLAAGTANIGSINNISATVTCVSSGFFDSSAGSTTLVRVGDSANSAVRVNIVAGGTGGGLVSVTGTVATNSTIVGISAGVVLPVNIGAISSGVILPVNLVAASAGVSVAINAISAGVSLAINAISAGVGIKVSGGVSLAAGTANIGSINNISATVNTSAFIAGISAGVTIGINSISATVNTNLLAVSAGVGINTYFRAPAIPSASRGPTCATVSTSAAVQLIATPGAGANLYVTKIAASNLGGTFCAVRVGTSATPSNIVMGVASAGGGFVMDFDPPWMLSASERAICSIKPNNSYVVVNAHFYVV
jgi:hypothetical protein